MKEPADRVVSAGMLTGRPEEEMPGSAGDLLQELSQLHGQIRQVMQGIAQALGPSMSTLVSRKPSTIGLRTKAAGARTVRN